MAPLEFVFQEQSYSSLNSGWSLAWGHFRGNIDNPFCIIANCCGVITDPCGAIANSCCIVEIPEVIGGARSPIRQCRSLRDLLNSIRRTVADTAMPVVARLAKQYKTLSNIVKHHETLEKHCDTS